MGWGGGLWGGKTEDREKERGGGGVLSAMATLKSIVWLQRSQIKKTSLNKDILMGGH